MGREDGQILPGLLVVLLALLAVGMLMFQVGRAAVLRSDAQTAADAAALAAAQEIALPSGSTPEQMAADYAGRNGATIVSCTCEASTSEAVVQVRVPIHLVFLGPDTAVDATARAVVGAGGTPLTIGDRGGGRA
jgi:secretion/DNA translocation related TadE-like protein